MSTGKNIEGIFSDPEEPLGILMYKFIPLNSRQLENENDARFYAEQFWDIYSDVISSTFKPKKGFRSKQRMEEKDKDRVFQSIDYLLSNENVKIIPKKGLAILDTGHKRYGFELDGDSSRIMRDVAHLGSAYKLTGNKYHILKTLKV